MGLRFAFELLEHLVIDLHGVLAPEFLHPAAVEFSLIVGDGCTTHIGSLFGSIDYPRLPGKTDS